MYCGDSTCDFMLCNPSSRPNVRMSSAACLITWFISCLLAIIPTVFLSIFIFEVLIIVLELVLVLLVEGIVLAFGWKLPELISIDCFWSWYFPPPQTQISINFHTILNAFFTSERQRNAVLDISISFLRALHRSMREYLLLGDNARCFSLLLHQLVMCLATSVINISFWTWLLNRWIWEVGWLCLRIDLKLEEMVFYWKTSCFVFKNYGVFVVLWFVYKSKVKKEVIGWEITRSKLRRSPIGNFFYMGGTLWTMCELCPQVLRQAQKKLYCKEYYCLCSKASSRVDHRERPFRIRKN